jgi:hypothetical protein
MGQEHNEQLNPNQAQKYLTGIEYPANKEALVGRARANGADQHVMSFLERIPQRDYESPSQVTEELSNLKQAPHTDAASEDKDMDNKAAF